MTMTPYVTAGTTKRTPQSEPIPGREAEMGENNAGGVTFTIDVWGRLDRFLILGTEGGTYYAGERKHTAQALDAVRAAIAADGRRAVDRIVSISEAGRAPKNDPAIYALAVALKAGDDATRAAAAAAVPKVCRIGTHILHLAEAVKSLGGWGRGTRRAFAGWYLGQEPERLAYQLVKYQQRDGWSHRDILRKAHPKTVDATVNAALRWAVKGEAPPASDVLRIIEGFEKAKAAASDAAVAAIIRDYKLPREAVPTSHLASPAVWEALLEDMPLGALVRNLGKMSAIGLLSPLSAAVGKVTASLADRSSIRRSRLHPLALLVALRTYAQGHGEKGKLSWTAVGPVVDALDAAFYMAFDNVEPTGKRWLLACDVSGSMESGLIVGMPGVTPRVAVGALAMVMAKVEPQHCIVGFTAASGGFGARWGGGQPELAPILIGERTRLDDVCKTMAKLPMGGTDCALPMTWAHSQKIPVDVFVVLTDNETWAGSIHPSQALRAYRQATGIPAKLVVVGMTATEFTIADPTDAGMLDCVGFDAAAPAVMADFAMR